MKTPLRGVPPDLSKVAFAGAVHCPDFSFAGISIWSTSWNLGHESIFVHGKLLILNEIKRVSGHKWHENIFQFPFTFSLALMSPLYPWYLLWLCFIFFSTHNTTINLNLSPILSSLLRYKSHRTSTLSPTRELLNLIHTLNSKVRNITRK